MSVLMTAVTVPMHYLLRPFDYAEGASAQQMIRYFKVSQSLEHLLGVIAALGIAYIVRERLEGRPAPLPATIAHSLRRWLPGAWTEFLSALVVGLLTIALIVPGIIWLGYYSFTVAIVSLRDDSGTQALARSKRLVRGRWWKVARTMLALFAVAVVPAVAISAGLSFLPQAPWLDLLSSVLSALPFVFVSTGSTLLFLNLEAISVSPAAEVATSPVPHKDPASQESVPLRDYDY